MQPRLSRIERNGLQTIQIDCGDAPKTLVFAMHGYGAPGDDLVGFAEAWLHILGEASEAIRFVFPAAPLTLAHLGMPDGRAWWELNMQALMESVQARDISELRIHEPPGLNAARSAVVGAIDEVFAETGLGVTDTVLGGFSQGAMLATDVALRGLDAPPAGLFLYSGTLICEESWRARAATLRSTTVIQSHGTADMILPFEGAEALRDLLVSAGVKVDFVSFPGGHGSNMEAIEKTADLIRTTNEADV